MKKTSSSFRVRNRKEIGRESARAQSPAGIRLGSLYWSALRYLIDSKRYIIAVIALFLVSILAGFLFPTLFTHFNDILRGIVDETEGLSMGSLIIYIFANNFQSSLYGMLFGVFFGLFPIGATILNGTLLGYVLRLLWGVSGTGEFWRILPHGIFELPAVFISLGLGIQLGSFIFARRKLASLAHHLYHALLVFILIVVPLLVIAATIEGVLIALSI